MAEIEVADLAAFSDADFDELTTGLDIPVGARLKLRTQFRKMCKGGQDSAMMVPASTDGAVIVPDYNPTPVDSTSDFTELEHQDQRLVLLGQSMPLRSAAGGACAFVLLVVAVLVIVGFNSANDSCVGVECGAYGACMDGRCTCQPGYTGESVLVLPCLLSRRASPTRSVLRARGRL